MFKNKVNETTFVVFDIETTGFSPINDQMIEIGAVKIDSSGNVIDTFSKFIKLYKIDSLPPKIKELTKISDNMLEINGNDIHEVMDQFCNFISDSVLVAQNAKFDMSFLAAYFIANHQSTFSRICFDTISFAKILKPNETSYKLTLLAPMFDVKYDADAHHRADYDAKITSDIFINQLRLLNLEENVTIFDLLQLFKAENITEKQESFLNSLVEKHSIQFNEHEYYNKFTASSHIDLLLNINCG